MFNGQKTDFVPIDAKAWPETQPTSADRPSVACFARPGASACSQTCPDDSIASPDGYREGVYKVKTFRTTENPINKTLLSSNLIILQYNINISR